MRRRGSGAATLTPMLILALASLVGASLAWGYGYYDIGLGTAVFQGSARGAAMGEVTLLSEDGPLAAALNPARLAGLAERRLTVSYRAASLDEDWAFRVHDSFDAVMGYNTYAANSNLYHDLAGGMTTGRLERAFDLCLGFAVVPVYDFRYDYAEEIRDRNSSSSPADRLIANNYIEGSGLVRSASFSAAKAVGRGFSLGLGVDYLFGERDLEARIVFADPVKIPWESDSPETSDTFEANDLGGARLALGATYAAGKRVEIAATYKSGVDLDGAASSLAGGPVGLLTDPGSDIKCPSTVGLGVSFRPRNALPTVIEGNVVLTRWSEVSDPTGIGPEPDDTYEWHIGVEHVFYNGRPLRFGFLYRPSSRDKETGESAVTAGTGLAVADFDIDLAARVGWREYRWPDLFADDLYGATVREGGDLVRETTVGAVVSVSRRF
jgi:hypothetical protein